MIYKIAASIVVDDDGIFLGRLDEYGFPAIEPPRESTVLGMALTIASARINQIIDHKQVRFATVWEYETVLRRVPGWDGPCARVLAHVHGAGVGYGSGIEWYGKNSPWRKWTGWRWANRPYERIWDVKEYLNRIIDGR